MQSTVVIRSGTFTVSAICFENDKGEITSTPALDFLHSESESSKNDQPAKGFQALFKQYSIDETNNLTENNFHLANLDHKIFEFIKGPYRIFCFKDGNTVILTTGSRKSGNKASKKHVATAIEYKEKYFEK